MTAFYEPEPDPLRGQSLADARSELTRLLFQASQLEVSLRHIPMTQVVRENVERERNQCEAEAFALECRIEDARHVGDDRRTA